MWSYMSCIAMLIRCTCCIALCCVMLVLGDYVMAAIIQLYFPSGRLPAKEMYTILTFCVLMGKAAEQLVMSLGGQGMLAGFTHRVMTVIEACDRATAAYPNTVKHLLDGDIVQAKQLDVVTPTDGTDMDMDTDANLDTSVSKRRSSHSQGTGHGHGHGHGRLLIRSLNLNVPRGVNVAITGPSGSGKSGLIRTIRGMWGTTNGTVTRPRGRHILFVPQSNYTTGNNTATHHHNTSSNNNNCCTKSHTPQLSVLHFHGYLTCLMFCCSPLLCLLPFVSFMSVSIICLQRVRYSNK